jgi:Flp pilus assembly protein TadG
MECDNPIDKMVVNMYLRDRTEESQKVRLASPARRQRISARARRDHERGAALVEFAVVVPLLLTLVLGMCSFGVTLNQYLQLTSATTIGSQYLAVLRGPNATDPCAQTISAIETAAPLLNPASMTFSFSITYLDSSTGLTTTYPYANSTSCKAAVSELSQGEPVYVKVTYPCTIYVLGNTNILPGCTLTSEITEISQ